METRAVTFENVKALQHNVVSVFFTTPVMTFNESICGVAVSLPSVPVVGLLLY